MQQPDDSTIDWNAVKEAAQDGDAFCWMLEAKKYITFLEKTVWNQRSKLKFLDAQLLEEKSRLGGEIDTLIKRIERALADENQEQA